MPKFKVGDRIMSKSGDRGEILEAWYNFVIRKKKLDKNKEVDNMPKFKVGDKIVAIYGGTKGTITEVSPDGVTYTIDADCLGIYPSYVAEVDRACVLEGQSSSLAWPMRDTEETTSATVSKGPCPCCGGKMAETYYNSTDRVINKCKDCGWRG